MDITKEQVQKIFELAGLQTLTVENEVDSDAVSKALIAIEQKLNFFDTNINFSSFNTDKKNVLVVDDLELSIYQLSNLLKRIGLTPSVARNKEEACAELKKKSFNYILIDLFLPEPKDGFEVIANAVKIRSEENPDLHILVISGTDDKVMIDNCYKLGVDAYIAKSEMWHTDIFKYIHSTSKSVDNADFSKHIINPDTVSYVMKRFNNKNIYDSLTVDINTEILDGRKNVLLHLENILVFDSDNAYVFADIYKLVAEQHGTFVMINPSDKIKDALSFAYLEGVIPLFNSVELAIDYINKKAVR